MHSGHQQQLQPGDAAEHPVVAPVLLRHRHLHPGGAHQRRCRTTRASSSSARAATRTSSSTTASTSRRCRTAASGISRARTSCRKCRSTPSARRPSSTTSRAASSTSSPRAAATRYRGAGSFYIIPPGLVGNNTPNEQFPYKVHYNQQGTFELGGPIVKDRAWFYGILPAAARPAPRASASIRTWTSRAACSYKPFAKGTVRFGPHDQLNVGFNNNMFCCGATASRTAPLDHADGRARAQPGADQPVHAHVRVGDAVRGARRRHLHPRQLHAGLRRLHHARPHRSGHRLLERQRPDRQQAVPQPHHRRCLGDAQRQRLPEGLARLQVRRADRRMRPSAPSASASATSRIPISTPHPTWPPSRIRWRRAAASAAAAATSRTTGRSTIGSRSTSACATTGSWATSPSCRPARRSTASPATPRSTCPNTITYPAVEDLISFNTWSPRFGITLRADKSGKTVVKANYGRFFGKLATSMFNSMSPGATPTTTLRYNTATRALRHPVQRRRQPHQLQRQPGSAEPAYRPAVRRPRARAGRQHGRERVVRLEGRERLHPLAGRARHATRSGRSSTPSRVRDVHLDVFNLTSSQASRLFQVVNRDDFDQSFKSAVIELNKRFSNSWQSQAPTRGRTRRPSAAARSPAARSRTSRA